MQSQCSYCSKLTKAVDSSNFCSKIGDDIRKIESNAFYFNANHLHSGEHISRLTFRSINRGYQYHTVGKKEVMLDAHKFLIINEGEPYSSEVDTNHPIEGLVIAFSHQQARQMSHFINSSHELLLDNPFEKGASLHFHHQTFNQTKEIKTLLATFKKTILLSENNVKSYHEQFHQLLLLMMNEKKTLDSKINLIKVKKKSTRMEIFNRLSIGKEYIDAHLDEEFNLSYLSRISTMSPFHFLRCFKAFYGLTPHQYLNTKRLQKAKFLLDDTDFSISKIAHSVGFGHSRSFRRLFKQYFSTTPKEFRHSVKPSIHKIN